MIESRLNLTHSIPETRKALGKLRESGHKIGFVPTMGALHQGHVSLMHKAKEVADIVVVSIFVNPTQFGPGEDFKSYPRTLQKDLDLCDEHGISVVFQPDTDQMYPGNDLINIYAREISEHLCGKSRPGHFDGVLQVVNKLFNIVQPDVAVFGQKDIQQLYIVRQMVADFKMSTDVVMVPTRREPDGLAISSRNVYLNQTERKSAPFLYRALCDLAGYIHEGGNEIDRFIRSQSTKLEQNGLSVDYLSCVEPPRLLPASKIKKGGNYILAGAVFAGRTRLIDNLIINT